MTTGRLTALSTVRLLETFAELAQQAGSAVLDSEASKARRAIRGMWAIEDVLRSRGRDAKLQLATLLDQKDRFVRY